MWEQHAIRTYVLFIACFCFVVHIPGRNVANAILNQEQGEESPAAAGAGTSGVGTSGVRTFGVGTSAAGTSGVRTSGVRTSGVGTSDVSSSGVGTSGVGSSGDDTSCVGTSGVRTSGVGASGVGTSGAGISAVGTSGDGASDTGTTNVQTSGGGVNSDIQQSTLAVTELQANIAMTKAFTAMTMATASMTSLANAIHNKNGLQGFLSVMETLGSISVEMKTVTSIVTLFVTFYANLGRKSPTELLNDQFQQLNSKLDYLDKRLDETVDKIRDEFKIHDYYNKRLLLSNTERDYTDYNISQELADLHRLNHSCLILNPKHTIHNLYTGICEDKSLLQAMARSNNFEKFATEAKLLGLTLLRTQSLFFTCSKLNFGYSHGSQGLLRQNDDIANNVNKIIQQLKETGALLEASFPNLVGEELQQTLLFGKAESYEKQAEIANTRLTKVFPTMKWLTACGEGHRRNGLSAWPYVRYRDPEGTFCAAMNASLNAPIDAQKELDRCMTSDYLMNVDQEIQAVENAFSDCLICGYEMTALVSRKQAFFISSRAFTGMSSSGVSAASDKWELANSVYNIGITWRGCDTSTTKSDITIDYGCYNDYCWSKCSGAGWPFDEWCYTTRGSSQDYKYVKCTHNKSCKSSWNCAGPCSA